MKCIIAYMVILALLLAVINSKKLSKKHHHHHHHHHHLKAHTNFRFKSLDSKVPEDDYSDEPEYDDSNDSHNMINKPQGMQAPDNAPDIPEEMPDYLEKELDMLKEQEEGVVNNIY